MNAPAPKKESSILKDLSIINDACEIKCKELKATIEECKYSLANLYIKLFTYEYNHYLSEKEYLVSEGKRWEAHIKLENEELTEVGIIILVTYLFELTKDIIHFDKKIKVYERMLKDNYLTDKGLMALKKLIRILYELKIKTKKQFIHLESLLNDKDRLHEMATKLLLREIKPIALTPINILATVVKYTNSDLNDYTAKNILVFVKHLELILDHIQDNINAFDEDDKSKEMQAYAVARNAVRLLIDKLNDEVQSRMDIKTIRH